MFIKTQNITTKRNGQCNSRWCKNKAISKGEKVIWTVHTYRSKTISAIWHKSCHTASTQYAPQWDKLIVLNNEIPNTLPLPKEAYCKRTGQILSSK